MKDSSGYPTYDRYDKVLKILAKGQWSPEQLIKKTKIQQATMYRILKGLLVNKKIVMVMIKKQNSNGRPLKIYKLKQSKRK